MLRWTLVFFSLLSTPVFADCRLFYATRSDLENRRSSQEDIQSLGRVLNDAIKASYDFLEKIDRATLGLVSTVLVGRSLENIRPTEWDKIQITGSLLYRDQPFNIVPIRGAELTFEANGKKQQLVTGTRGEFAGYFYELVSYTQFRLFPHPTIEVINKQKPTLNIPIHVSVSSKVCNGSFTVDRVPLEPISIIIVAK